MSRTRKDPRVRQQDKAKFIGSDGSVLDDLPSEMMMDPETISSLDQGLANLTNLSPYRAASNKARATATATSGVGGARATYTPAAVASMGQHELHDFFAGGHSEHVDESREEDADACDGLLDNIKPYPAEGEGGGAAAGDAAGHDADDEQEVGVESRPGASGGKKRKKDSSGKLTAGEATSEAQKQKARWVVLLCCLLSCCVILL